MSRGNVAIVGSGLAGLELAAELKRTGVDVTVFEQGPVERLSHEGTAPPGLGPPARRRWWSAESDHWGGTCGLKVRIGGRSLCWHGVLLPIEDSVLAEWPSVWRDRLAAVGGLYAQVVEDLGSQFAAASSDEPPEVLGELTLRSVPQAADWSVDIHGTVHGWRAYTPLTRCLKDGGLPPWIRPNVTVQAVAPRPAGVRVLFRGGGTQDFDVCVLAAGSVRNTQFLAASTASAVETVILDHLCLGAVATFDVLPTTTRQRGAGTLLGYFAQPELRANIFIQEMSSLADGRRMLDIWAIAEQDKEGASVLRCGASGRDKDVSIAPRLSIRDEERLDALRGVVDGVFAGLGVEAAEVVSSPSAAVEMATGFQRRSIGYTIPLGLVDHESTAHSMATRSTRNSRP